jgi:hypothetical protein
MGIKVNDILRKGRMLKNLVCSLIVVAAIFSMEPAFALTADPMDIGVGARSIGMGKAYTAVAEDSETVFVNPAGLGTIKTLKLGSMYTSLLSDIQYVVMSGAYPLDGDSGTIGAGIIYQSANDIHLYSTLGTSEGLATYGNSMVFVSYGFDASKKWLPSMPGLYGGATIKYIMVGADGKSSSGVSDLSGSGFSSDIALLYKPQGAYSYGLTLQNIISGGMSYKAGENETIGSSAKVGTKIAVLGDSTNGSTLYQNDSQLDVALDYNMGLTYAIPATLHVGLEYKPQVGVNYIDKILTLRGGVDQVPSPSGNLNALTMGVGIYYQGVEFNYAYTPAIGDLPDSSSHFFSISYVGIPEVKKPIEEMKPLISQLPLIETLMPGDKMITKDNKILVQGKLTEPAKIAKVEINGAGVNITENGAFEMNVPLENTGKHLVTVKATDTTGRSEERSIRVIRLVKFADVNDNHWADAPISKLATAGLIEGYPNGTFQPERALSRAELATLLVKAKGAETPVVTGKVFKDLPATHWASRYVKVAQDMGMVMGYPDKTFKPNNKLSRTEGVVVMARFGSLTTEAKLSEGPYPDLTAKNWASPYIAAAKGAGFLAYLGDKDFEPKKEMTRAEAVEILSKTSFGTARIDSLFDWTVGFEPTKARPSMAEISNNNAPVVSKAQGKAIPQVKDFADVPDEFFASDAIKYLATAGIMNGYPDNTFRPERIVTRAELSAILVKAKNIQIEKGVKVGYSDVTKNSWAAPYIKASVDAGFMTGKTVNKFEPARGATRAETVAAIVKFDEMALSSDLKKGPFPDMTARDWSAKYVAAAKEGGMLGYLEGQDFEPQKSITRAELAQILAKTKIGQSKINEIKSAGNYKSEENM